MARDVPPGTVTATRGVAISRDQRVWHVPGGGRLIHPPRSRRHVWQCGLRPTAHGRCFATVTMRTGPTGDGPTVEPTAPCRGGLASL